VVIIAWIPALLAADRQAPTKLLYSVPELLALVPIKPSKDDNDIPARRATDWARENLCGLRVRLKGKVIHFDNQIGSCSMTTQWGVIEKMTVGCGFNVKGSKNEFADKIHKGDTITLEGVISGARFGWGDSQHRGVRAGGVEFDFSSSKVIDWTPAPDKPPKTHKPTPHNRKPTHNRSTW